MFPTKARTGVGGEGCATYPDLVTQDILHLCIEIPSYTLSIYTIIVSIKNLKHIFKTLSMITQLVAASAGIRTLAIRSTYRHIITVSMTQLWRRVCHIIYWSWDSDTVESTKKIIWIVIMMVEAKWAWVGVEWGETTMEGYTGGGHMKRWGDNKNA